MTRFVCYALAALVLSFYLATKANAQYNNRWQPFRAITAPPPPPQPTYVQPRFIPQAPPPAYMPPLIQPRRNTNCTSRRVGNTTYTNCY